MRTLKNGKDVKYYVMCPECSSHLEYEYDDIRKSGGTESGGRYIVCPVCEERIKVSIPGQFTAGFSSLAAAVGSCGCK